MTVKFPTQTWHAGVGDHIMRASAFYSKWLQDPSESIKFIVPDANGAAIWHWPFVDYKSGNDREAYDAYEMASWGDFRKLWDGLGLDWQHKRMFYFLTTEERCFANGWWSLGKGSARIVVQAAGGMSNKRYRDWNRVINELEGQNITLLDHLELFPQVKCRRFTDHHLRRALALVATADLFIGFDSGPLYAALGSLVPSVAIYPALEPEILTGPLIYPRYTGMIAAGDPNLVPWQDIVKEALAYL